MKKQAMVAWHHRGSNVSMLHWPKTDTKMLCGVSIPGRVWRTFDELTYPGRQRKCSKCQELRALRVAAEQFEPGELEAFQTWLRDDCDGLADAYLVIRP